MTLFKRKRLAAGLSRRLVAETLKITVSAVGKWDRGVACPAAEHYPALAALLGMTAEEVTHLFDPQAEPSVA